MNESIDHLYRRNATERPSEATDNRILAVARTRAQSMRKRRQLGVGATAAAALALLIVYTSRHAEDDEDLALRAHYAAVARPYLLVVKLDPAVAADADTHQPTNPDSR